MVLVWLSIPVMILAVAIATVPLLALSAREDRRRWATATALADRAPGEGRRPA